MAIIEEMNDICIHKGVLLVGDATTKIFCVIGIKVVLLGEGYDIKSKLRRILLREFFKGAN